MAHICMTGGTQIVQQIVHHVSIFTHNSAGNPVQSALLHNSDWYRFKGGHVFNSTHDGGSRSDFPRSRQDTAATLNTANQDSMHRSIEHL
jgi:hypothetical protein